MKTLYSVQDTGSMDLAGKIAFLSNASVYPQASTAVDIRETHMSWVFLTDQHVYKLKKPVHIDTADFSSLSRRYVNCREEIRLNRRLAPGVYLGLAALKLDAQGELYLEDRDGSLTMSHSGVVEWLVKMRRLDSACMLDQLIATGRAGRQQIEAFIAVLSDFYKRQEAVGISADEYRQRMRRRVEVNLAALQESIRGVSSTMTTTLARRLDRACDLSAALLAGRARQGQIVEGHGDLRPEHIYACEPPLFIDCLEFDRNLRILDPLDELAFLGMECELAGAGYLSGQIFACYCSNNGDTAPGTLIHFYKASNALVRARLAFWHLRDARTGTYGKWIARTRAYLQLVDKYLDLLAC